MFVKKEADCENIFELKVDETYNFKKCVEVVDNEVKDTEIQTSYLSALDFWRSWVWDFELDELDFCSTQAVKIKLKLVGKNPVYQTGNIKLGKVV